MYIKLLCRYLTRISDTLNGGRRVFRSIEVGLPTPQNKK